MKDRLRSLLSPWNVGLAAAVVAATLGSVAAPEWRHWTVPLGGGALVATAATWYWRRETRVQPEALPKLRVAGFALLVLMLCLVNAFAVSVLTTGQAAPGSAHPFLLAVAAACVSLVLAVIVDLTLARRRRWSWPLIVALGLVALGFLVSAVSRVSLLVPAALVLGLTTPMEWVFALGRTQRRAFLGLGFLAVGPLAAGSMASQLFTVSAPALVVGFVRLGSMISGVYLAVLLVRTALATPGARAFERKAQELDAVYDFSLSTQTAFDPQEFDSSVLRTLRQIADPDVAAIVRPTDGGRRSRCRLVRVEEGGANHTYEFRVRRPWSAIADRFADRRPLEIVDQSRAQVDVLRGIWEPRQGCSVIVPILSREGTAGLLIAGRDSAHAYTHEEVESIAGFASQVALAYEHASLLREAVEAERRKRELEIARDLQLNLLPRTPPTVEGLEIADRSTPATEVGGDYFDYLSMGDGHLGLAVGDVAGHGMPAGLLMAMAKSAIHVQIRSTSSIEELMARLAEMLLELSTENQFMTMVFSDIDVTAKRLRYVNAGHHAPLHYRASTGEIERLDATGIPLGLLDRSPGSTVEREIGPGDVLVYYSDGLVEAFNPDDEQFGIDLLGEVVAGCADQPASRILAESFAAVDRFRRDVPLHDDATLVVVRVVAE